MDLHFFIDIEVRFLEISVKLGSLTKKYLYSYIYIWKLGLYLVIAHLHQYNLLNLLCKSSLHFPLSRTPCQNDPATRWQIASRQTRRRPAPLAPLSGGTFSLLLFLHFPESHLEFWLIKDR